MPLTPEQKFLLDHPARSKFFLHGAAGTGKTTAASQWLNKLIKSGIPAHEVLIFVPQRSLADPFQANIETNGEVASSLVSSTTLGGLARRMVDLYWPIISHEIGVDQPTQPPHFLTLETAQYYMAHIVRPLIEQEGFFESLTINRNRIYSQILDNLNKAAFVGFNLQEIGERLKRAWVGELDQLHIYDNVQECANRFRAFCLQNNLLDYSLQVEIFVKKLWPLPLCRDYLVRSYRHLIADNLEEDTPVAHDILREWLPEFDSALLVFDEMAGYRYFLGADVSSAFSLHKECEKAFEFKQNLVNSSGISELKNGIQNAIACLRGDEETAPAPTFDILKIALIAPEQNPKYFPGMVSWVANQVASLIEAGTPPAEIVVLAPFMPDVLRFALSNQLDEQGIPNQSHRPSRPLREEPATQTLLTLAKMAFPSWGMLPDRINLSYALMQVIEGLDLVRAQLLTDQIYPISNHSFNLKPFENVAAEIRDRVTYRVGERYDHLRNWLETAQQEEGLALDFFLNRLFGEVLSQPGFRFHNNLQSGNIVANLVESIQKFRWAIGSQLQSDTFILGKEYIQMVEDGVIAAQYIHTPGRLSQDAVFLSPAYTFLIGNQAVDYQFWLDIGSPSWYQRLDQPLTQPYVLSRNWEENQAWTADHELAAAYQTLQRLSIGLLNRCRKKVFIGISELDIRGYENRGLLIRILQQALQSSQKGRK